MKKNNRGSLHLISLLLVFALFAGLAYGFKQFSTQKVSSAVLSESDISSEIIQAVRSRGIVDTNDQIQHLAILDTDKPLSRGYILTGSSLLLYLSSDEGLKTYKIHFDEIEDVYIEQRGTDRQPSRYRVTTDKAEEWMLVELPTFQGGDQRFIRVLRAHINKP